jgi:hypothetical protein
MQGTAGPRASTALSIEDHQRAVDRATWALTDAVAQARAAGLQVTVKMTGRCQVGLSEPALVIQSQVRRLP